MADDLDSLCWRWELTPKELLAGFHFIQSGEPKPERAYRKGPSLLANENRPFAGPKLPLEGTPYSFQIALSLRSVALDIQLLVRAHPELPVSGDRRSGVLVFDGEKLIGSLTIRGMQANESYKMVVDPQYRQQGLAFRMVTEWSWATKRKRVLPRQGITLNSTRALLASHRVIVDRAVARNLPVPDRVIEAITKGEEAEAIIREATRIEQLVLKEKHGRIRSGLFGGFHGR